jgi:hypothetical protein
VPSTLPPPPTPFLELSFWIACPDTSDFEAYYPMGNIKILVWFCFTKFPFGLPSGDLKEPLHQCRGCSPLHCLCLVLCWVLFAFNMTLIRRVCGCERGERDKCWPNCQLACYHNFSIMIALFIVILSLKFINPHDAFMLCITQQLPHFWTIYRVLISP